MDVNEPTQSEHEPQTLSSDLVAVHLGGCLSFEQIMACVDGTLNQVDQDTVMAHLAACPSCSAKFTLAQVPTQKRLSPFRRVTWRWWLLAAAGAAVAAALLLFLSGKEQAPAPLPSPVNSAAPTRSNPTPPAPSIADPVAATPPVKQAAPVSSAAAKTPPAVVKTAPAAAPAPVAVPATKQPAPPEPALKSGYLMTRAEAALPASSQPGFAGISIDDGPTIVIDRPRDGATVASGFPLYILYDAEGRETIDLATVKLVCRKQPPVNLTARIKQHITEKGIWIESVHLPPGDYRLKLSLADSKGRAAEREFSFKVVEQNQP